MYTPEETPTSELVTTCDDSCKYTETLGEITIDKKSLLWLRSKLQQQYHGATMEKMFLDLTEGTSPL